MGKIAFQKPYIPIKLKFNAYSTWRKTDFVKKKNVHDDHRREKDAKRVSKSQP